MLTTPEANALTVLSNETKRLKTSWLPQAASANRQLSAENSTYSDAYAYDPDTGGVITADRFRGMAPSKGEEMIGERYRYGYDKIGNRKYATSGPSDYAVYSPNQLNQYGVLYDGEWKTPVHDADGNLTHSGNRQYLWGENPEISVMRRLAKVWCDSDSRRCSIVPI